jgi:hypothetical protein
MENSMRYYLFCFALFSFFEFSSGAVHAQNSIEGVWRVSDISREYNDQSISDPLPSQIIFTNSHYSMVWMPIKEAIPAFETRWQPTDEEKLQRFVEIVVNSGTYSLSGSDLRIKPVVARFAEFIGGYIDYRVTWVGDDLILTLIDEVTFDGVRAPWVAQRRDKEHLTLVRKED